MSIIGDGIMLGAGGESASILVTGVSETDTVTVTKDGKTVIGKWVSKPNPISRVPDGYTQLEYIQSSGTQRIVTNYVPKSTDEIDMVVIPTSASTNGTFWCARGSTTSTNTYTLFSISGTDLRLDWSTSSTGTQISNIVSAGTQYNINTKNGVLKVDGSAIYTASSSSFTAGGPISLFASYYNGTSNNVNNYLSAKVFSFSVKNSSGAIVLDLIPCKRNSDSAIGMYDLVNGVFYTNSGTGTFTAGAEIPHTIECWEFTIKQYGTYIITANNEVTSRTQEVLIDSANVFYVEIRYDYFEFDFTKMTSLDELYTYFNTSAVGSISLTSDGLLATISSSAGNYASINLWPKTNLGSFSAVYGICKPISYSSECVTLYAGDGSYSATLRPMNSAFYYYTNSSTIQQISSFGTFTAGNTYSIGAKITEDHKQVLTKDGLSYTVSLPNTGGWPNLIGTIILAQCGTNNTTQVLWKKVIFSQRDYEVTL